MRLELDGFSCMRIQTFILCVLKWIRDDAAVMHKLFHWIFGLWGQFLYNLEEHFITDIRNYKFVSSKI